MSAYLDNLRPFEKRMVVAVGAMVFVVLNFWFVVPHFSDWSRVQDRMAKARSTLKTYEAKIAQVPNYTKLVKELESEGAAVPPEEAALHFSTTIQENQDRSGVHITRTGRQTTRTNQFFLVQTQPISVESEESQMVGFLYNLGDGNLIRVRDLSLRPDQPRHKLSAEVKLEASYQKNPSKSAPASAHTASMATEPRAAPPAVKSTPPTKPAPFATKATAPAIKSAATTNKLANSNTKRP